jgi:hypothetical protein
MTAVSTEYLFLSLKYITYAIRDVLASTSAQTQQYYDKRKCSVKYSNGSHIRYESRIHCGKIKHLAGTTLEETAVFRCSLNEVFRKLERSVVDESSWRR